MGSGSTFRGRVGFGYHNVGVVPLGFWGFGSPTTSLVSSHNFSIECNIFTRMYPSDQIVKCYCDNNKGM